MALLQQPIQRKLSALLGAEVTFEKLHLSLLGGSIEASGVTVASDDPAAPMLTIQRVVGKVAVGRALKGEIVVTSLTIERPIVNVVRRRDGSNNLPKPLTSDSAAPVTPSRANQEEADKSRWSFDVEKILLVDGEVHLAHELADGQTYRASVETLLAELKQDSVGYAFTILGDSLGRRDVPVELGQLRASGTLSNVADLTALPRAGLDASAELGELLQVTARMAEIRAGAIDVTLSGKVELAAVLPLLPSSVVLPVSGGTVIGEASGRYDSGTGVQISELNVHATEARFAPRKRDG